MVGELSDYGGDRRLCVGSVIERIEENGMIVVVGYASTGAFLQVDVENSYVLIVSGNGEEIDERQMIMLAERVCKDRSLRLSICGRCNDKTSCMFFAYQPTPP